jgi:putative ABC transport system substrate-binding protein
MRELGYIEGRNVSIELRSGEGKAELLPAAAAELVQLKVDIIVSGGNASNRAAKNATGRIPIVMTQDDDPVANGLIASLAHPGGNVTGLSNVASDIIGKRLELLNEAVPKLSRVTAFVVEVQQKNMALVRQLEETAQGLGLRLQILTLRDSKDIEYAFQTARKNGTGAIAAEANPVLLSRRKMVADLAVNYRLPVIYNREEYIGVGGLMVYAASITDLSRRAAKFVDRILKGTNPAGLPVEQPTKFDLIINLKTAKQIGLTIPPNVLARADRVIR